mmetsp:Transcript_7086/g.23267  ORF Transcript_7086/g.23267 Transcript_7086/m.23267 type:complete len:283 (-) Transcript_7086:1738-2586(-)
MRSWTISPRSSGTRRAAVGAAPAVGAARQVASDQAGTPRTETIRAHLYALQPAAEAVAAPRPCFTPPAPPEPWPLPTPTAPPTPSHHQHCAALCCRAVTGRPTAAATSCYSPSRRPRRSARCCTCAKAATRWSTGQTRRWRCGACWGRPAGACSTPAGGGRPHPTTSVPRPPAVSGFSTRRCTLCRARCGCCWARSRRRPPPAGSFSPWWSAAAAGCARRGTPHPSSASSRCLTTGRCSGSGRGRRPRAPPSAPAACCCTTPSSGSTMGGREACRWGTCTVR